LYWLLIIETFEVRAHLSKVPLEHYDKHLSEWDFTHPIITNENGEFISANLDLAKVKPEPLTKKRRGRSRREIGDFDDFSSSNYVYMNLTVFNEPLQLKLSVNNGLLHPDMTVTSIYSNMTYEEPVDPELRKCYLHGVINTARNKSSATSKLGTAAVSVCNGLNGLIHHQNEFIFIEPVHEDFHSVKKAASCSLSS